jgi:hypothetical protein
MGIRKKKDFGALKDKLRALVSDFTPDLEVAGEAGADAIIQTTLAGIGVNDQAFRQYSKSYLEQIEAVGGKPSGVVDLRGIFFAKGGNLNKRGISKGFSKRARSRGAGRQAYVFIKLGGKNVLVKTKVTRPRYGATDPNSEMSRDLITIEVEKLRVKLIYRPRRKNYMILHNRDRVWFTVNKTPVREAIFVTLQELFKARIAAFKGT